MKRSAGIVLLALLLLLAATGRADEAPASGSMAQYHLHLQQLQSVLAACEASRSKQNCDPALVGSDDRVQLAGTDSRLVSYTWLREALSQARTRPADKKSGAATNKVLRDAAQRLTGEAAPAGPAAGPGVGPDASQLQQAHTTLRKLLASKQFPPQPEPGIFTRVRDWFLAWLAERLLGLAAYSSRSPWITWAVIIGAIALAAVALFWWLQRGLRTRAPSGSTGIDDRQPAATPDWQRWLAEADALADAGRWRDGIHSIYWAAIARLESRGLWRTNRSRTPREYLGLLPSQGPRRSGLALLTRTFERTWYADQPADAEQYRAARAAFDELAST